MNGEPNKIKCFSCGAYVPDVNGPVHRYMDSSPGCWKLFGQILAKEYSDPAYWKNHRITIDAYAVQHYGKPSPQAIHSVNLHLASLYLIYEKDFDVQSADKSLAILAKHKTQLRWLSPPKTVGKVNVTHILEAINAEEHNDRVYKWGFNSWTAWEAHHRTIEKIVEKHI